MMDCSTPLDPGYQVKVASTQDENVMCRDYIANKEATM
jgi:hypothetical protein